MNKDGVIGIRKDLPWRKKHFLYLPKIFLISYLWTHLTQGLPPHYPSPNTKMEEPKSTNKHEPPQEHEPHSISPKSKETKTDNQRNPRAKNFRKIRKGKSSMTPDTHPHQASMTHDSASIIWWPNDNRTLDSSKLMKVWLINETDKLKQDDLSNWNFRNKLRKYSLKSSDRDLIVDQRRNGEIAHREASTQEGRLND